MQFTDLIAHYDGFIIDLWGVVHDGTQLYPGAADALQALHDAGKPVVFLSNAPRRAEHTKATLTRLGIAPEHYRRVITSGEVAYDLLAYGTARFGTRYYYLGPSKDENILDGLASYTRVADANDADFVLNTGYEIDFQPHAEVLPTLNILRGHDLPLICANPDLEVVKQDGTHILCAGTLAAAYEALGGRVTYIGKPHADVYDVARRELMGAQKLLAIGDNPLTDILGANRVGIDSLLILGGVLSHHHGMMREEEARAICAEHHASATYVTERFSA